MGEFSDKKKRLSDFNEATLQIFRLHGLWLRANQYAFAGSLNQWKWILDVIARELYADIKDADKDKENDKYEDKLNDLNKNITKAKKDDKSYVALQEKDNFLRYVQDSVGKGGRRSDHFEDIM